MVKSLYFQEKNASRFPLLVLSTIIKHYYPAVEQRLLE